MGTVSLVFGLPTIHALYWWSLLTLSGSAKVLVHTAVPATFYKITILKRLDLYGLNVSPELEDPTGG